MWVGKNESAAFWMGVLTDLKARGIEDILITVTDNLNGFTETIKSVFRLYHSNMCGTSNQKFLSVCGLERKKGVHL